MSYRKPLQRFSMLLVLTLGLLILSACGGSDSKSGPSGSGATASKGPARQGGPDTLVSAWISDLTSMDPPVGGVEANWAFGVNVYEPLVGYSYQKASDGSLVWEGLGVAPQLAESWDIDGAKVTFKLRKGVKFYPSGNEMTATDVKYSFVRTNFVEGGTGKFNSNLAGIFDAEKQLEILDPYTIRFTFTNAQGEPILLAVSVASLRFVQFHIVDSKVVQSHASAADPWASKWMKDNTAGTGPYYVASRTPGQETIVQAVPNHWAGKPAFSKLVFRVTAGADLVSLMKRGEIDYANSLGTRELDALAADGFKVINHPIPNIVRADLALDAPGLDKPAVRAALAYAMPYDQIQKVVFSGRGERAYSVVNPKSPGFDKSWEIYTTNVDKAKQSLKDAGVTTVNLTVYYDSSITFFEDIALLMKDAYGKIGVNLTLRGLPTTELATLRTAQTTGKGALPGIILSQGVIWLDDPDPNIQAGYQSLGSTGLGTLTRYANPKVDELHLANRFSTDKTKRNAAYVEIQKILAKDVPTIPIVITGRTIAMHPSLTAVLFAADQHPRLWTIKKAD